MELKIFVTIIVLTATLVILYFFIKNDQTDSKTNQKTSDSVTKKTMDKDDIAWEALPEEFVVFDLETTGLKNQVPVDIVEISAVKVVKDTFRESGRTKTFSAIVRPWRGGINPEAAAINQITQQMIDEEGKEISSTIREFVEFVGDSLLVAYNVSFDRWFLKRELQDQGISKHYKYECALELARVAFPDLKNHKLTTVADHMGINTQGAHRALQDCVMALQVYVWSKTKIEAMKSVENAVISFKERLKSNPELVGKSVVFTGTLELMPRPEAEKLVTLAGMIVRTSLSKKTDLVVAGKKPGKKLEQALALNKVPLTEIEFWQLLQPEIPEACESNQDKS